MDVKHIMSKNTALTVLLGHAKILSVTFVLPLSAAEVAKRHNAQFKELGRVKCKFLAYCQTADDTQGFKLTNEMVLQGMRAYTITRPGAWLPADLHFLCFCRVCQ